MTWTRDEAIEMCRAIEAVAPRFGCHVALTGGLLYKEGPRKDCDIVMYRIRQEEAIDGTGLMKALSTIGMMNEPDAEWDSSADDGHWVMKAMWHGKRVDIFFPEADAVDWDGWDDLQPDAPETIQ